jgi:uncharacterized phage-associated protein
MYTRLTTRDIRPEFRVEHIPRSMASHIDNVLDVYAKYSDDQLEELTHQEAPWMEARGDCSPRQRCEEVISNRTMRKFYGARVSKD